MIFMCRFIRWIESRLIFDLNVFPIEMWCLVYFIITHFSILWLEMLVCIMMCKNITNQTIRQYYIYIYIFKYIYSCLRIFKMKLMQYHAMAMNHINSFDILKKRIIDFFQELLMHEHDILYLCDSWVKWHNVYNGGWFASHRVRLR